jgi:hypothetical protein
VTQLDIAASPTLPLIREELRRRRTHVVRHVVGQTGSLEKHLFNTFYILAAWQQPPRVQYAGLMHSVYSTDVFNHRTFNMNERDRVRALVGEMAERLAYLFCTIDRRELLSVVRASANEATATFELTNRLDRHPVHVTRAEAGDLLTIYMANAAEQSCPTRPLPRPVAVLCFASGSRGATTRRRHSSGIRRLHHPGFHDRRNSVA